MDFIRFNLREFCGHTDFVESFESVANSFITHMDKEVFLAGGAVRRVVSNNSSLDSDFDFFFVSEKAHADFVQSLKDIDNAKVVRETKNSSTFKVCVNCARARIEAEVNTVPIRFFESVEKCIESFDFTACMFGYDGENVITTPQALWDLGRRRRRVNKITYPVASLRRLIKYTKQGFYACDGAIKELLMQSNTEEALRNFEVTYVD